MKNLVRNSFLTIVFLAFTIAVAAAKNPYEFVAKKIPLGRDFLKLSDGRWIWLLKTGRESTRAMIGRGAKSDKRALWFRDFKDEEYRNGWDYAYFVFLKPNRLVVDLDGDGTSEVGIATFDYGNSVVRNIMIFTVRGNRLMYVRQQGPFNLEADLSVFR